MMILAGARAQRARVMMENDSMGQVVVAAKVEKVGDLFHAFQKGMQVETIRRLEIVEALVDTGATNLAMPGSMIRQLGLMPSRRREARTSAGLAIFNVFGAVRLTVQGRECTIDVTERPDDRPVLIGQVPLELLDFVVDPKGRQLVGNPAHGGEQMMEMY